MSETVRKKYCVNGEWKDSKTSRWMPVTNSSTGEVLAEVPCCTAEEVEEAIASAQAAFPEWSRKSLSARTQMMFKWRNVLTEHLEADASVFQGAWKDPFGSEGRRPEGNRADGTCLRASHAYAGGCVPAGDDRIRYGDLPDAPWRRGRHCTL